MRNAAISLLLVLLLAPVTSAQVASLGVLVGGGEPTSDGFDFELDRLVRQVFIGTTIDTDTSLRFQFGDFESDRSVDGVRRNGTIDFATVVAQYEFDEIFGSTGLFAGIGYYREKGGSQTDDDFGWVGGVNGTFPVTRKFAMLVELAYHRANLSSTKSFVAASGGLKLNF